MTKLNKILIVERDRNPLIVWELSEQQRAMVRVFLIPAIAHTARPVDDHVQ